MKRIILTAMTIAVLCVVFSPLAQAGDEWKKTMKENLEQQYGPFVKMGRTAPQNTGAVYQIVSRGINAAPAVNGANYVLTKFSPTGQISGPSGLAGIMQRNDVAVGKFRKGDEVYVIQVLVSDDHVDFRVVSVDPRDVNAGGTTYQLHSTAQIRFEFEKGVLAETPVEEVIKHITWALNKAE